MHGWCKLTMDSQACKLSSGKIDEYTRYVCVSPRILEVPHSSLTPICLKSQRTERMCTSTTQACQCHVGLLDPELHRTQKDISVSTRWQCPGKRRASYTAICLVLKKRSNSGDDHPKILAGVMTHGGPPLHSCCLNGRNTFQTAQLRSRIEMQDRDKDRHMSQNVQNSKDDFKSTPMWKGPRASKLPPVPSGAERRT